MSDSDFEVRRFPLLDTGIGREFGYADDREFAEAIRAKRGELPDDVRAAFGVLEAHVMRQFLFGSDPPVPGPQED